MDGLASGEGRIRTAIRAGGLFGGPAVALALFLALPESFAAEDGSAAVPFTAAGRATLAVMAWMGIWWLTEAIDISATALLPIALFPLLGIATMAQTTAPYADHFIFLFLGGFILALSMQRWGLDRRIALITLRMVGTRPPMMIGGFMLVTAALSMWVSNTATAAMMLPIAISVVDLVVRQRAGAAEATRKDEHGNLHDQGSASASLGKASDTHGRNFALSLMLGIAYAASIGGIGTIIGSPPNIILVKFIETAYGERITFGEWMIVGCGFVIIFLPLAWVMITWVLYPIGIRRIEGGRELIQREYRALGPMKAGEWATFIVFICTAGLWVFRPFLQQVTFGEQGSTVSFVDVGGATDGWQPLAGLHDTGIALLASMALFLIPVSRRPLTFAMNWRTAEKLPWGILILFGGGLSLAAAVQANGVAEFLGAQARVFGGMPDIMLVLAVTTMIIFLTELTSNTATTATMVPVLAGLASGLDVSPYLLIFPATLAASCAFMMPVATPPNAIVFGSGHVTIPQMAKAGLWLNLLGIALITLLSMTLLQYVLPAM